MGAQDFFFQFSPLFITMSIASSVASVSKFGCIHMSESVILRRVNSISSCREFLDEEFLATSTFEVPCTVKTIKVENLKGSGRIDLVKMLKDLDKVSVSVG